MYWLNPLGSNRMPRHFWDRHELKSGLSIVIWDCGRWKSGQCLLGGVLVLQFTFLFNAAILWNVGTKVLSKPQGKMRWIRKELFFFCWPKVSTFCESRPSPKCLIFLTYTYFHYHCPTKYLELMKIGHNDFWQIITWTTLLAITSDSIWLNLADQSWALMGICKRDAKYQKSLVSTWRNNQPNDLFIKSCIRSPPAVSITAN